MVTTTADDDDDDDEKVFEDEGLYSDGEPIRFDDEDLEAKFQAMLATPGDKRHWKRKSCQSWRRKRLKVVCAASYWVNWAAQCHVAICDRRK